MRRCFWVMSRGLVSNWWFKVWARLHALFHLFFCSRSLYKFLKANFLDRIWKKTELFWKHAFKMPSSFPNNKKLSLKKLQFSFHCHCKDHNWPTHPRTQLFPFSPCFFFRSDRWNIFADFSTSPCRTQKVRRISIYETAYSHSGSLDKMCEQKIVSSKRYLSF